MNMHDILLILFKAANILAITLLSSSYVLNVIAKARSRTATTAPVALPVFSEQAPMIKKSFGCGTLFILLNWGLCSSRVLEVDQASVNGLSEGLLTFAIVWAIMIFIGIVTEIVLKCFRSSGSTSYSVVDGIKSSTWYSALYFILSFLIA